MRSSEPYKPCTSCGKSVISKDCHKYAPEFAPLAICENCAKKLHGTHRPIPKQPKQLNKNKLNRKERILIFKALTPDDLTPDERISLKTKEPKPIRESAVAREHRKRNRKYRNWWISRGKPRERKQNKSLESEHRKLRERRILRKVQAVKARKLLKPWKDRESLFCDGKFLTEFFGKTPSNDFSEPEPGWLEAEIQLERKREERKRKERERHYKKKKEKKEEEMRNVSVN